MEIHCLEHVYFEFAEKMKGESIFAYLCLYSVKMYEMLVAFSNSNRSGSICTEEGKMGDSFMCKLSYSLYCNINSIK